MNTNKAQHHAGEPVKPKRKSKRRQGRRGKFPDFHVQQTEVHTSASSVLDAQTTETSELLSTVPDIIQPAETTEFSFSVPDIKSKNEPKLASPVPDTQSTKAPECTSSPLDTQPTAPELPTYEDVSEPEVTPSDEKDASFKQYPKRSKTEIAFYNDVVKQVIELALVDIAIVDNADTTQELSEDICQYISHSCYINLLQIINNGCQHMRDSNRTKFTVEDFYKGLNFYRR